MTTVFNLTRKTLPLFSVFSSCTRIMHSFTQHTSSSSNESDESLVYREYLKQIKEFIPKLKPSLHKGQCGRIGVIGGSVEYTGAPYFAAMSALKTGADLVYVFCCRDAAPVIKSYSPELIVNPLLDSDDVIVKIEPWLMKLNVLVIGPGLGRDEDLHRNVRSIVQLCKDKIKSLPLVIDADGLYMVSEYPDLIKLYKGPVIVTPNPNEYNRFTKKFLTTDSLQIASELNCVLVEKGQIDLITNGIHHQSLRFHKTVLTMTCDLEGSHRRCGGQGDILAGCLATFAAWFHMHRAKFDSSDFMLVDKNGSEVEKFQKFSEKFMGYSLAAYAACTLTKVSSRLAFDELGRGMTASDMIPFIHRAFVKIFGP